MVTEAFRPVRTDETVMVPEKGEEVFWRFYPLQMAKGSGLGFSIAKELVEMQGGTTTVESQQGKGTKFTVRLAVQDGTGSESDHDKEVVQRVYLD